MNAVVLAEVAIELDLGAGLLLGKGEDAAGGREKQSILADAFEAVIAAVYLDGGSRRARDLVLRCSATASPRRSPGPAATTTRRRLQELARRRGLRPAALRVDDEGPDHAKHFFARVASGRSAHGEGEGRSKKQAEQAAARVGVDGTCATTPPTGTGSRQMPELPEVEAMRRDLEKEVVGKKIKAVEVTGTRSVRRHEQEGVHQPLDGRKIMAVQRRGSTS